MRLWTLHPRYLDAAGLVAVWREGLLARAVLRGRTRGYRHHPQLLRFRNARAPVASVNRYLMEIYLEAERRGYRFDRRKIARPRRPLAMRETTGQLDYEWKHLLRKLRRRSPARYRELRRLRRPQAHPLFRIIPGPLREWERGAVA
jgi:pyrimidine dimer DNA glycosylase